MAQRISVSVTVITWHSQSFLSVSLMRLTLVSLSVLKCCPVMVSWLLRLGFAEIGSKEDMVGYSDSSMKVKQFAEVNICSFTVKTISELVISPCFIGHGVLASISDCSKERISIS